MPDTEEQKPQVPQDPALNEKLMKTRSVLVSGEIDKDLADRIVRQLLVLESESNDPIYIYINSPGGDVDAGYAMFDMVRFISCDVYMVGMGLVASAAALLYVAVPLERRLALPNSTYLIHQPMSGMQGVATDIEIHARQIEKLRKKLDALLAQQTGKSLQEISRDTERDYWLDAEEAKAYGLVSKIVTSRSDL